MPVLVGFLAGCVFTGGAILMVWGVRRLLPRRHGAATPASPEAVSFVEEVERWLAHQHDRGPGLGR